MEFLEIDEHLVAAAAEASTEFSSPVDLATFVDQLPKEEQRDFLRRFARDETDAPGRLRVRLAELARLQKPESAPAPTALRRRLAELLDRAEELKSKGYAEWLFEGPVTALYPKLKSDDGSHP